MPPREILASDLFQACRTLFGDEASYSSRFLGQSLQMSGLKAAYRKRARETHPDLARSLEVDSCVLEERFKEVQSAFERLRFYVENPARFRLVEAGPGTAPTSARREGAPARGAARKRQAPPRDCVHAGPLPAGPLPFGRFLFYSGAISHRTLIEALVWQKGQRPPLGAIARQWGWLSREDILGILRKRVPGERFGECAVRQGFIDGDQLRRLTGWQRVLQPRLGAFFAAQGILTAAEVDGLAKAHRLHNWKVRRGAKGNP